MKKIFGLMLLLQFCLASTLMAAAYPQIRGTWRGDVMKMDNKGDIKESRAAFVINKQQGPLFAGYKIWFGKKNTAIKEAFNGIIGINGTKLYFAEHDDGYSEGVLIGKQNMAVYYLENGKDTKAIYYQMERIHFKKGFITIDKNGDKTIMRSEITTFYPLNAERILREADANKDGKLTKKEWDDWKQDKG